MIQIVDSVKCDAQHRSIVAGASPAALEQAVLAQDVGSPGLLFALLMIDNARAVLVTQGKMNLNARAGAAMQKLRRERIHSHPATWVGCRRLRGQASGVLALSRYTRCVAFYEDCAPWSGRSPAPGIGRQRGVEAAPGS
jgi:hypothetical protein